MRPRERRHRKTLRARRPGITAATTLSKILVNINTKNGGGLQKLSTNKWLVIHELLTIILDNFPTMFIVFSMVLKNNQVARSF